MIVVEISRVDNDSGRVKDHFQVIVDAQYVSDSQIEARLRRYLKNSILYDSDE